MKAINTHTNNADVCCQGCGALMSMTASNGKNIDKTSKQIKQTSENKVKAGAAGGIEAMIKVINTHINNADVCENGCGALYNITANNGKNDKQNK